MALSRRLVGRVCQRRGRAFALGTADRDGAAVALAGSIAEEEALPLAALVMYRLKGDDLAARLFTGEIVSLELDEPQREVAVGVVELGVTVRRRERAKA